MTPKTVQQEEKIVKDFAWQFMLYEVSKPYERNRMLGLKTFCKEFKIKMIPETMDAVLSQVRINNANVIHACGIIRDEDMVNYESFDDYIKMLKNNRIATLKCIREQWIGTSKARKVFVNAKPKTKKEQQLEDKKEEAINVIEEYYDLKFFTWQDLNKDYILIKERDYGNNNRIGIMIKQESYVHQFTIVVRGILGAYNICNHGDSVVDLELEEGAVMFSISKTYKGDRLPTLGELIDDICIYDLLEQQPPIDYIRRDTSTIPIYPTAKQYFNTNS